jgi:D-serine dehydratase
MMLGIYTGLHDEISVKDIGIDNITAADGLAVGRASGFVGRAMERLLDGFLTITDERMYRLLGQLSESEDIQLEPSALAGMIGPVVVTNNSDYRERMHFDNTIMSNATHLVWATGGGMVPEVEMTSYIEKSKL